MSDGRVLALFDFDKTLVSRDSFLLFADLGARSTFERLLLFGFAVATKLRWIDNARYKTLVLRRVWRDLTEFQRKELLARHAQAMGRHAIEAVWGRLHTHLERGDRVAILSASPAFYLLPYIEGIASEIEVHASAVSEAGGKVSIENLYRERKAVRAREVIERHAPSRTVVYTDHRDDLAMMRLADHVVLVRPQDTTRKLVEQEEIDFEVLA